jgi:hypothetical protein
VSVVISSTKSFLFGQADQIAIGHSRPASFVGRCHIVACQEAP